MKSLLLGFSLTYAAWAQNVDNGKKLFETKACYECHGWQGQGGLPGPRLAQTKLTLDGFRAILRNPPAGNMPPYRTAILSDREVADIFAYVQSFPAPQPSANIPLLKD